MARHRPRSRGPQTRPALPWWPRFRWQAAAVAGLVLIAYWNSLEGAFHFDDWSLLNDPFLAARDFGAAIFRPMQTRPLTFWTFHLNFLVNGSNPFGFHVVNVLVHAANAVLVLWIARRYLSAVPAFLAAALFAVHPLQTEAVSYIFQRASLLGAFFALLCFALFLAGRYTWSALAFGASLAAKEEALALPAFLILWDYFFGAAKPGPAGCQPGERKPLAREERNWRGVLSRKSYYAALLALDALAAGRLFYVLARTRDPGVGFAVKHVSPFSYALTQSRVVWRYLRLVVAPYGQNLDYDFRLSRSLLDPPATLPAVVLLVGLVGGLACLAWRRHAWAFWVLGFLVLLAPSSSFIPQSDVIYEHRTYLPMISMVLALAWLLAWALERFPAPGQRLGIAVIVVGLLLGLTIARNRVWATELTLWTDVVRKSPGKLRPYIGYSRALSQENRAGEAMAALQRGLALKPDDPELNLNLGVMILNQGQPQAAYEHFQRALHAGYSPAECWSNLGAALLLMKEPDRAIEAFRRALDTDRCFFNARRNLVFTLANKGEKERALELSGTPAGCHWLPEQERSLDEFRTRLGQQLR